MKSIQKCHHVLLLDEDSAAFDEVVIEGHLTDGDIEYIENSIKEMIESDPGDPHGEAEKILDNFILKNKTAMWCRTTTFTV